MEDRPAGAITTIKTDFWRCYSCRRLVTKPEMDRAQRVGGTGSACPCGGTRYQPTNCPRFGLLNPRVFKFFVQRLRGVA